MKQTTDRNYWEHPISLPDTINEQSVLVDILRNKLADIGECLGWGKTVNHSIIQRILNAHKFNSILTFEHDLGKYVQTKVSQSRLRKALDTRASKIVEEISGSLAGSSILDIGCGDGMVPYLISDKRFDIQLMDVVNYVDVRVKFPFTSVIESNRKYDTILLLTVLHHCEDPLALLQKATDASNKRIIIIESVVGVSRSNISNEATSPLYDITFDDQVKYAVFVDWFYNRILHSDVPVPYNFTSPSNWKKVFSQLNLNLVNEVDLGIDQPLVPEHHYLFVLDKT